MVLMVLREISYYVIISFICSNFEGLRLSPICFFTR